MNLGNIKWDNVHEIRAQKPVSQSICLGFFSSLFCVFFPFSRWDRLVSLWNHSMFNSGTHKKLYRTNGLFFFLFLCICCKRIKSIRWKQQHSVHSGTIWDTHMPCDINLFLIACEHLPLFAALTLIHSITCNQLEYEFWASTCKGHASPKHKPAPIQSNDIDKMVSN